MDSLNDSLMLSRLQFAFTAMFHIIWPLLTVGLSIFLVVLEAIWLKTQDRDYYILARFWSKLFLLNFAIGVVSGIPMEFEFGTNWAPFSHLTGEFFGNILGYDGAMALMLEAGFFGDYDVRLEQSDGRHALVCHDYGRFRLFAVSVLDHDRQRLDAKPYRRACRSRTLCG